MLRDDIKATVIELLHKEFDWIDGQIDSEEVALADFDIDSLDMVVFSLILEKDFNIYLIKTENISKWTTVKDIVDYVEDNIVKTGE